MLFTYYFNRPIGANAYNSGRRTALRSVLAFVYNVVHPIAYLLFYIG